MAKNSYPKVYIIILNYNGWADTIECLESVLRLELTIKWIYTKLKIGLLFLGCCVITGKRGSAAYFEDVPIPDEYKFDDKEENISKIIEKIKDCFENFENRYKDFDYYRQVIKQEPKKFIEDLKKIFVKVENE